MASGLWKNMWLRAILIAVCLASLASPLAADATVADHQPQLLLSAQRLRRLKRDRERQTIRWTNFDTRVQAIPDSPERGFELALYYSVTGDEKRGREAIAWGLGHPCETRQRALILDWLGNLLTEQDRAGLASGKASAGCPGNSAKISRLRDALFTQIATTGDAAAISPGELLDAIQKPGAFTSGALPYAACEYLASTSIEVRESARQFFVTLPIEFLLSLKPEQIEHPDWMTHIAALALVNLDPNLESSQYVQGWAMEDKQMVREGPGVAYEFLWANPYLPGVGYQNLDPWIYDTDGRLFARSDWNENACWVEITTGGIQESNCPSAWQQSASLFGRLTLIPMVQACVQLPQRKNNEVAILWKLHPHQVLSYVEQKQQRRTEADPAGMWRAPANVEGKVCTVS